MSVNVVNKTTGALTKVAGNAITEASGINYSHTTSGMSATNVQDAIDESYSTLKSGLTNLDNEVNGDATTYPYADVITIDNAVPSNLADCSVKIEPVQDLHGYDHPWVGGAGKNKAYVNINSGETALTEIKDNDNNVIGVNADVDSAGVVVTIKMATVSIENGKTYTLSGSPNDKGNSTYRLDVRTQAQGQLYNNWNEIDNPTITATEDVTLDIYLRIAANYAVNNLVFHPQIEEGSSATTFAPYTNICPISGHTEVDVQRDGKNLWEFAESYSGAGGLATNLRFSNSLKPNTYVLSCKGTFASGGAIQFSFMCEDGSKPSITLGYDRVGDTYYSSRTFTKKIVGIDNIYSNNAGNSINDVQLELGSTATPYEPYQGKTYTIALGDTIYGGTVDFDSGVMSSYGDIADEDGFTWIDGGTSAGGLHYVDCNVSAVSFVGMSNMLPKEDSAWDKTYPCVNIYERRIRIYGNFTSLVEFKEQYSGLQVYYQKATPTTIQLTPQQIQLLKGQNTITASTGQISVTVNGVSGSIGALTADKQDKTDYTLETTAKTVVGAINELNTAIGSLIKIADATFEEADANGMYYIPAGSSSSSEYVSMFIIAINVTSNLNIYATQATNDGSIHGRGFKAHTYQGQDYTGALTVKYAYITVSRT